MVLILLTLNATKHMKAVIVGTRKEMTVASEMFKYESESCPKYQLHPKKTRKESQLTV